MAATLAGVKQERLQALIDQDKGYASRIKVRTKTGPSEGYGYEVQNPTEGEDVITITYRREQLSHVIFGTTPGRENPLQLKTISTKYITEVEEAVWHLAKQVADGATLEQLTLDA